MTVKAAIQTLAAVACMASCAQGGSNNPLLQEKFGTPYEIPPFELLTLDNYREAILVGMDQKRAEIKALVESKEEPTFENTILAMDQGGELFARATGIFFNLCESNSSDEMMALQSDLVPLMTALGSEISMNDALFQRVKKVYENRNNLGLDKEQLKLTENTYKTFERGGANLSDSDKKKLKDLNARLSELELSFEQNLMHETNNTYVTVTDVSELEGLPEANIQRAAEMAKSQGKEGAYMFNMQRASCNPVLQYCKNRDLRKKVYDAYYNRGNQDNEYNNKAISKEIVQLRLEKAQLMGYKDYASMELDERMAKTEEAVYELLDEVWNPAVEKAKEEIADIRAEIRKEGGSFEPEGWDYMYYSDKAKAAKYAIDETQLSEYFEIDNVIKGVQYVAGRLYGLSFTEKTGEFPTYEPTARVWEVRDKDGELLAIFYGDYFPRDGKGAGAWCTGFRGSSYKDGKRQIPIVVNVCSFTPSQNGGPALQSIDNVETLFHEFGHALDAFMCDARYSGTSSTETDFVELPSQIDEHWAFEPEVLKVYAKHYQTGEVIPQKLVDKVVESGKYGQGFATVEYVAASYTDMDLHVLKSVPEDLDVLDFEQQKLKDRGIPSQIYPRYRMTNFSHTMGGGYSAGYYSYMWAEVLDCDAFEAFKETGDIFNQEVADRFRKHILASAGIEDGMTKYIAFRGHKPGTDALLRKRGLK